MRRRAVFVGERGEALKGRESGRGSSTRPLEGLSANGSRTRGIEKAFSHLAVASQGHKKTEKNFETEPAQENLLL